MSKVILVTGGSSGIGKAVASYLAELGHRVIATSRSISTESEQANLFPFQMDVRDENSVRNALEHIRQKFGRLDVLVNNAGLGMAAPLEFTSGTEARNLFETNVLGLLSVCRESIPLMREQGGGHIINITSIGGNFGLPFRGVYCASKSAVNALSESLSLELKKFKILVSVIEPGDIKTEINSHRAVPENVDHELYPNYAQAVDQINREVEDGLSPLIIAKRIEKIISSPTPLLYYWAARPIQRLSVILKRILPSRLFERMLRKHYRI